METMERDPEYIAKTTKLLRKMFGLTQENLADATIPGLIASHSRSGIDT